MTGDWKGGVKMKRLLNAACSGLALLLCCGCMATSASGKSTGPLPSATTERLTAATGRFVEADITPPQLDGRIPLAVIPYADGAVDVFVAEADGLVRLHSADGTTWEQETPAWAKAAAEKYGGNVTFSGLDVVKNGVCYVALSDAGKAPHLLETRQDGTFEEIPVPAWEAGGFTVKTVTAMENGDLGFTYDGRNAEVIEGKTGRVRASLGSAADGVFAGKRFAAGEDASVAFYDLATGEHLETVGASKGRGGAALAAGERDAVYIATQSGIGRLPDGGSVFETIVDSDGYSFGGSDVSIEALARQPGAEVFYLLLLRQEKPMLYRYVYQADAPARPERQLTVFSMEESGTVQRAVIELQRADPSITVRYQVGAQSPLSREETLRSLKNELKNGKGPDVLILDGIDGAVYDGALADPGEPADLAACFPNIAAAGVKNGKRYAIPTRFLLPMTVGEAEEIKRYGAAGNGQPTSSVTQGTPLGKQGFRDLISASWNKSLNNVPDTGSDYREMSVFAAGTLQPSVFAAVTAGENQELARQLIALMLTEFVQQGDFEEGFPVRMDSFDEVIKEGIKNKQINIQTDMKELCLSQKAAGSPPDQSTADFLKDHARIGY